jgi:membrane associated rhomboid family serine protease
MRYYQQKRGQRLSIGQDGNALTLLIAVQLVVFVILAFIKVIYFFSNGTPGLELYRNDVLAWVALPASGPTFITRPWTLLTHMFVHDGVWHLIANMLWLWGFGYILQDLAGNRKLFPLFFYGGLAGAAVFMLSYNLIPALRENVAETTALGASAGVMAIAIGTTVMAPDYRIFPMINGGIPLWVLTLLFVVIDLATIPYNNPGGHLAHLAGGGMGLLFVHQLRQGRDWGVWINAFFDWATNLFNPAKPKRGQAPKTQLYYKSTVQPYKKTVHLTQQKVDEILEKIHQKGYQSLSEDEKDVLKRASKEDL